MKRAIVGLMIGLAGLAIAAPVARAAVVDSGSISIINSSEVLVFPDPPSGSGEGTLDAVLFTFAGGGGSPTENSSGSFDMDDANSDFPTGGGPSANGMANESYITSMGELRDFYVLNFPDETTPDPDDSTVNEIVLFVDVNETGGDEPIFDDVLLDDLDIVIDYTVPSDSVRQDPANNDVDPKGVNIGTKKAPVFNGQNPINDSWQTGMGTRIAKLGSGTPYTLVQAATGTGRHDVFILTGINPFDSAYSDSTRVLFWWNSHGHNNGGEDVFLSGTFRAEDLCGPTTFPCPPPNGGGVIPEPTSLFLMGSGLFGLFGFRASRKRRV